ncbi:MAG: hypothetical protein VYE04_04145, partial [Pseudomonadota bacterium]|nr:hypothetical protein [Pseudomonadota bacterium]
CAVMTHSLEIRLPIVNIGLLTRIAPAIAPIDVHGAKPTLAAAPAKPLPGIIRKHPNTGLVVSIGLWLQDDTNLDVWRAVSMLRTTQTPGPRPWAYALMRHWEESP